MEFTVKSIGTVRSSVTDKTDQQWGDVTSEIHLSPEFIAGVQGLDAFSHILVLFYMHKSAFSPQHDLVRRPQGRDDMPLIGIFAQRAKHRPNPLGVTVVRLVEIKTQGVLVVKGLDAIDGTPVLDIKPYFPAFDHKHDVVVPAWVQRLMEGYF
jgi:tRNA-Thr(GGU) m(6)t(6)A37 methyltransferase TsaA